MKFQATIYKIEKVYMAYIDAKGYVEASNKAKALQEKDLKEIVSSEKILVKVLREDETPKVKPVEIKVEPVEIPKDKYKKTK